MSKAAQRAKFSELRALRQSGKKVFDNYRVDEAQPFYDELDEDGYKKVIRSRLDQDDFVVDDNGEGYADDGREEWDRVHLYESDNNVHDCSRPGRPRKEAKEIRKEEQSRRAANDQNISAFFAKGAAKALPKHKRTKGDEDFLTGILEEVDHDILTAANAPRKEKPKRSTESRRSRALSPAPEPISKRQKRAETQSSSPLKLPDCQVNGSLEPMLVDNDSIFNEAFLSDPAPSSSAAKAALRKGQVKQEPKAEDDEDMMEVAHADTMKTPGINITASRPLNPPKLEPYLSPNSSSHAMPTTNHIVDSTSWNDLTARLNVVSSLVVESRGVGKIDPIDAMEPDGSLNFFWTDYVEVNGSLCLFGKVLNRQNKSYVSCFVKIDNILRKVYFLPRQQRVRSGSETDEPVQMTDVYGEVDEMMTKMNVGMYKIKACTRKYAFEMPDVPSNAQYLKLLYPYTKPLIDMSATGQTFSHMFGTNTALFEQFVLWKKIMGPCWLRIRDADCEAIKNASHCKLEVLAENPDMVSLASDADNLDCPPLTLMSIALRTAFNSKDNKQEILAISARIYDEVLLSDTTAVEQMACRTFTVIRPHGQCFPLGFEQLVDKRKRGLVALRKHESDLLSFFLAQVDISDPDVILGHQLEGADYSILLSRLYEKKTHQWSRLGRFRRTQWPTSIGKVGSNVFVERQIIAGRLLCDLANDAGKSAMYKCQSWSLTEMCSLYLSENNRRRYIDNEAALNTWAKEKQGLMDYIAHLEADTYYIAALAIGVQLLPLTKVLTNLAGNSWARTLTGTRAERNEFILLHEFYRIKYICPDKRTFRGRQRPEDEVIEYEGGEAKKKDKYKGGLVFEPQKGLYDKFVLVMDFNSLYPSIIQEFNICFTTVDRFASTKDEDAVPEVRANQEQGILPRLIATLVSRRRQVKSLMKDKNATAEQLATWDLKQLALKLTANSMYGCLGYTKSRFYARHLAVLTTYKGREILCSTKELAESKSLQVIYGDTDSVMINANVSTVADALKVGNEFKKAVNDQYKLLEIDIDNVFRRILLQAKKKYAAVSLVQKGDKYVEQLEVKGLDMKRREYCALSKEISKRLLDEILSGGEAEVAVGCIHEYLREMANKMREQAIPTSKYIIYTQLGKAPKEYPNAESMPQVQVALRDLARGKTVRKGDVVSYIITGDSKSTELAPKRAYAPSDLKADISLQPDVEWYLGKQIFPPVERLCANIVGTSTSQLAEQLGLSILRFESHQNASGNGLEVHPLESQVPDEIRFSDCDRLYLQCRKCKASATFEGLAASPDRISALGVMCIKCGAVIPPLSVVAQVEHAVRTQTRRYYEGWLICDDAQCGNRTRQMSVYGTRCLGPKGLARDCLGRMRYEYTEKAIYNQLVYFASLWDVDKARAKVSDAGSELSRETCDKILALAEHNRVRFGTAKGVIDRYLEKCGRQWVAMDTLFTKLGFNKACAAV